MKTNLGRSICIGKKPTKRNQIKATSSNSLTLFSYIRDSKKYTMNYSLITKLVFGFLLLAVTSFGQTALVDLDCSSIEDFNIVTKAPAGVKAVEKYGSVTVSNDKTFQMEIHVSYGYNLAEAKKSIEANDINKLKKYVIDEANGILYQTEVMGQTQYHFVYFLNGGETTYYFENVKGPTYDLAAAKTMYEAAKASVIKK